MSQNILFYFSERKISYKDFSGQKFFHFILHLENAYKDFSFIIVVKKERKKFLQGTKLKRVFFYCI